MLYSYAVNTGNEYRMLYAPETDRNKSKVWHNKHKTKSYGRTPSG